WEPRQKCLLDKQLFLSRFSSHAAARSGGKVANRPELGCVQSLQSREYPRGRQLLHAGWPPGGCLRPSPITIQRKDRFLASNLAERLSQPLLASRFKLNCCPTWDSLSYTFCYLNAATHCGKPASHTSIAGVCQI